MANHLSKLADGELVPPSAKVVFYGLLLLLFVLAVGHLYLLEGLTGRHLGLPLWLWLQVVVVFAMLGIAWITIRLVAGATEGGD